MIDSKRLEQIKAGYELTTPGKWTIHYPQSRSKPQIVLVGKDAYLECWIAQAFARDSQARDDIQFACDAHQDIPELISEVERLKYNEAALFKERAVILGEFERLQAIEREFEALRGELRQLGGLDYREGIKQFREAMEQA